MAKLMKKLRGWIISAATLLGLLLAYTSFAQVSAEVEGLALTAAGPRLIAARIIRVALGFLGIVVLTLIIYGGFLWMTAAGNEETIAKAKKVLTNAIIGLAIILSAFAITQFVLNTLLEATRGPSEVTVAGCQGSECFTDRLAGEFTVKSIQPQGTIDSKKIIVKITLSDAPNSATVTAQNIKITRTSDNSPVEGTLAVGPLIIADKTLNFSDRIITFLPSPPCPEAPTYRCFDAAVEYKVEVAPGALKRARDDKGVRCGLTSVCEVAFTPGTEIDLTPPAVTLARSPASISKLGFSTLQANVTDNSGVALAEFYHQQTCPESEGAPDLFD